MKTVELMKNGDRSLILRLNNEGKKVEVTPFVVGYYYDGESWSWGHYYDSLESALYDLLEREIKYDKLMEISQKAIDGLYLDDPSSAEEYCEDTIGFTVNEFKLFGKY